MKGLPNVVVSAAVIVLVAVTAFAGPAFAAAAVLLAVMLVAAGWGTLVALPHRRGTAAVVAGSGIAAVAAAVTTAGQPRPLEPFAVILAVSVLAAFGHELVRRDGRPRLVESVTGTFAGQAVAVLGAGWLLLPGSRADVGGVAVAAAACLAARLATALPWPLRITGWIAIVAGACAGGLTAGLVPQVPVVPGAIVGASVAVVVAALGRLRGHQSAASLPLGMLAAAAAPVVAAGTTAYAVARLVLG